MSKLTKHEFVMNRDGESSEGHPFFWAEDFPRAPVFTMHEREWLYMGEPDVITVTVVPGNRLNDEEPIDAWEGSEEEAMLGSGYTDSYGSND